jgi:predicted fused transcriptional regulator/phosphomethylpyrimidine kinase
VNVRGGDDIPGRLEALGLSVDVLPVGGEAGACPVASHIASRGELRDAYVHPGGLGVEATTTILARGPEELVRLLGELARA